MTDLYPQNPADSHAVIAEWAQQPVASMAEMRQKLDRQATEIRRLNEAQENLKRNYQQQRAVIHDRNETIARQAEEIADLKAALAELGRPRAVLEGVQGQLSVMAAGMEQIKAERDALKAALAVQKAKVWQSQSSYARLWEGMSALLSTPPAPARDGEAIGGQAS